MKKVRGMLAAIAVLAVVGGALAFNVKGSFGSTVYTTLAADNECSVKDNNITFTSAEQTGQVKVKYTIDAPGACETTLVYTTTAN